MARIAIGGFQHETNTFAPSKARWEDFERAGGWPAFTRGEALFAAVAGINLPVAGFIEGARAKGHELVPLAWASATPSAEVTGDAFEHMAAVLLGMLAEVRPVDALYLDLHGAMVTEHLEDGEGELLARCRAMLGPTVPIVASLDLHANVTEAMVAHSSALVAYRTYPHIDMAETGARAATLLDLMLRQGRPLAKAFRKLPYLIPLHFQCTLVEPAKSLYAQSAALERGEVASTSFATGFPLADIRECGPALVAYGASEAAATRAVESLESECLARETEFAGTLWSPDEAVRHAMAKAATATRPVVLADTQDNPGAGGDGDTIGLLAALVQHKAEGAALAILCDPAAAAAAHRAGIGAVLRLELGGRSNLPGHGPFKAEVRVAALGDGNFTATGPFYKGSRMQLGPMARLAIGGVEVVVASRKLQAADQEIFRHLGIEPARMKILALKSSVHFRADFQPIAEEVLVVEAPGPAIADPAKLPYRRLRPGVRLGPGGAPFRPASHRL
ncbi:MAG TPA: M81 family metallopeptidase [Alphaproteobacteria bacterium]|nr:M81 family metallopeptidase [Alphaproteobacteria bacterium]